MLDWFHRMKQFGKAVDETRAEATKRLERDGFEPMPWKPRWSLLERPENLTDEHDEQPVRAEVVQAPHR